MKSFICLSLKYYHVECSTLFRVATLKRVSNRAVHPSLSDHIWCCFNRADRNRNLQPEPEACPGRQI